MFIRPVTITCLALVGFATRIAHAEITVRSEILVDGDIRIWEEGPPPPSFEDSLANVLRSAGAMQWWAEPILAMVPVVVSTEDGSSGLNIDAFEALAQNPPAAYAGSLRDAFPGALEVDADGTMERIVAGVPRIEQLRAFFERLEIPAKAQQLRLQSDPANLKILEAWFEGAQSAAAEHEALFYQRHPIFQGTNIVAAFRSRSLDHLLQYMIVQGKLYDAGALIGTASAVASWNHPQISAPSSSSAQPPISAAIAPDLPTIPLTEARGASNGAAFVYRDSSDPSRERCVTIGEPHQPSVEQTPGGPSARPKIYHLYPRNAEGTPLPAMLVSQGGGPVPFLSYSRNHGTSGTASPTFGSLTFFAQANGSQYLDTSSVTPTWKNFNRRTISYLWRGSPRTITVHSIPEFGDVFINTIEPHQSGPRHWVISQRTKVQSSLVDAYIGRLRYGLLGDETRYTDTLRAGGLQFYSEAGCSPLQGTSQSAPQRRAYYALNQGRTDAMLDENGVGTGVPNFILPGFRRTGSHDTPVCTNQRFATADNGSISTGCEQAPTFSKVRDPGGPTWRQLHFQAWASTATSPSSSLSRDEVINFATSTESLGGREIAQFLAASLDRFATQTHPSQQISRINGLRSSLAAYDGIARDTPTHLMMLYITPRFQSLLVFAGASAPEPIRNYFLFLSGSRAAAENALNLPIASLLNSLVFEASDFYLTSCIGSGVTVPSQAMRVIIGGAIVASGFTGPNLEARNSGGISFALNGSTPICQLRLTSSSPFSFVAFDDEVLYRTYGPNVSPHTLVDGLHESASLEAWQRIAAINRFGTGVSSRSSFRTFSLASETVAAVPAEAVALSRSVEISNLSRSAVEASARSLRPILRALLKQKNLRSSRSRRLRRNGTTLLAAARLATEAYRETIAGSVLSPASDLEDIIERSARALRRSSKRAFIKRTLRELSQLTSS